MTPFKDHEEVFEELQDKSEKKKGKPGKKEEPTPPADTILPTFPPKQGKKVVKTARAGGYIKAADGCAQRGKTKGRMV